MRGEIEDFDPVVGPRADLCAAHMWEQLSIGVHLWQELDVCAWFNNRLSLWVEHDIHVVTVSHAQLLAEHSYLAIFAVTDEDGALGWPDHYGWVLTPVDKALCYVVIHVELAVLAVVDSEVFASKFPWCAEQKFALLVHEEKLAIGSSLCRSIFGVPRVLLLFHLLQVIKLSVHLWFLHLDHCNTRDRVINLAVIVCALVAIPPLQGGFTLVIVLSPLPALQLFQTITHFINLNYF